MTYEEIKKQVQKICEDKVEQERKAAQEKADNELERLQRVYDMIENGTLFKKVHVPFSSYDEFVVIDINELAHDYQNKRECYDPDGIQFAETGSTNAKRGIVCIVNGHRYYSMERVIDGYDEQLQEIVKRAENAFQHAKKQREELLHYMNKLPEIKKMVETYRAAKENTVDNSKEERKS